MAIKINAAAPATKKKPQAKASASKQKTLSPEDALVKKIGLEKFQRMIELQTEIDHFKATMDEFENLRKEVSAAAMADMPKEKKFYIQLEEGLVEIPACSKSSVLKDVDLAKERLAEINPSLLDECFTPSITKIKSFLSGPMAEGVFDTQFGKSRLPKVKPGK